MVNLLDFKSPKLNQNNALVATVTCNIEIRKDDVIVLMRDMEILNLTLELVYWRKVLYSETFEFAPLENLNYTRVKISRNKQNYTLICDDFKFQFSIDEFDVFFQELINKTVEALRIYSDNNAFSILAKELDFK